MKPSYWDEACHQLSRADSTLASLIAHYASSALVSRQDAFSTLARSIIGQQISVVAAETLWNRFSARTRQWGPLSPQTLLNATAHDPLGALAGCGLSQKKQAYLIDLAQHFIQGRLSIAEWPTMSDEAVIKELTAVHGIGLWTAEMFLIFNLMRPDRFPVADIGLQKAIRIHYSIERDATKDALLSLAENWRPWRTVATWYLWRSLDPIAVEY